MKPFSLLLIAIGVSWLLGACQRQPPLTPQEQTTVNALTSHLKTRCVGRYLIDMPAEMAVYGTIQVSGVDIEAKAMSLEDYHKAMKARSDQLKLTKSSFGYQFLYADTVIEGVPDSRYFVSLGDSDANSDTNSDTDRLIEAYRWDRGHLIKMQILASYARDSIAFKDDPSVRNDPAMNNLSAKSQVVTSLLSRARGRGDDEIPNEPGVCFQGGFLSGPQWDSEKIETYFVLPAHQDVSFDLETNTDVHDDTTLLQRSKEINAALAHDPNGKAIRKGQVALTGMAAEEWLMQKTTAFKIPGFLFSMEANTPANNDQRPVVTLDMRVGAPSALTDDSATIDKASLTEGDAVGLWDAVSRTLRERPKAF
jgi:Tle cognate immunity protein 4 C-terminal domain/Tle cognate immunity protein 4 N-terminal domain